MKKTSKMSFYSILTALCLTIGINVCKGEIDKAVPLYYHVSSVYEVTGTYVCNEPVLSCYPSLSATLIDDSISNYVCDDFVPQGLTLTDDYIVTSCYDSKGLNNSQAITLDKNSGDAINICDLGNKAHVGGIAYDQKRNLLWISGENGTINAYNETELSSCKKITPEIANINVGNRLKNYKDSSKNSVAFLSIDDDLLYVGSFQVHNNGLVKIYKITEDTNSNRIKLSYISEFTIPPLVQGMSLYHRNEDTYLLLSRSYGKHMSSIIQIFKYDDSIKDYTSEPYIYYKAPSMLEQISTDNDKLYTLYESSAKKYSGGKEQVDTIYIFDLPKLTKKL